MRFGKRIAEGFRYFGERFSDGSVGTKLSHFIMGAGNFSHKQIAKGIIFFLVEVVFILFMVLCPSVNDTPLGYKALINLGDLGYIENASGSTAIDPDTGMPIAVPNSMLILLFGVVTLGVIMLFLVVYFANISSAYKADLDERYGEGASTFKQDLASMLDSKFHITMLSPQFWE